MRPIEFKAWLLKEKKMIYDFEIRENEIVEDDGTATHNYHRRKDIILLQYTGLLDKNGKKIFEGDIVRGWDYPEPFQTDVEADFGGFIEENIQEVKWLEKTARFHCNMGQFIPENIEIIGNVYSEPLELWV